jgi:hypothetical protein
MRLDMHLHGLASLAEIVINAIGAAIADTLDWHGSAAIASHSPMDITIPPGLVLSYVVKQVEQVLTLSRGGGVIIPVPPRENALVINQR